MATERHIIQPLLMQCQTVLGTVFRRIAPYSPRATASLFLASVFFAASLTPSMMPRDPVMQGLLGGTVAIIGYGFGSIGQWLWTFLELPTGGAEWRVRLRQTGLTGAAAMLLLALWKASDWQNATRTIVGLAPVEASHPITILLIALLAFIFLWLFVLLFQYLLERADRLLKRFVPPRVGVLLGFCLVAWLFWAFVDGVLIRYAFKAADSSFRAADLLIEPTVAKPVDPQKSGSPASLVKWEQMGRWGRDFISRTPSKQEIAAFAGKQAMDPVRVYVGLGSGKSARARADLALRELVRVGGFKRSVLVVMVPVGTGWMDPGSQDVLDFILGGDVATVSVQYSYLKGAFSVLANSAHGAEQARELFDAVYRHWSALPKSSRPKLYVHGLSQGAFISQQTLPFFDILDDPIQGALWVGSPFFSPIWRRVLAGRKPDSAAWLPRYGNGSFVRVGNQYGGLEKGERNWGPIRMAFLNYGSDPIVAFSYDLAYRRPDWLKVPRAPDVSPELRWFPVVTMLQIALDTTIALNVPGYGHYYIARDYIDAWAAVLSPSDWNDQRAAALKEIFTRRRAAF
jgi:uncharacterized membrane protein